MNPQLRSAKDNRFVRALPPSDANLPHTVFKWISEDAVKCILSKPEK